VRKTISALTLGLFALTGCGGGTSSAPPRVSVPDQPTMEPVARVPAKPLPRPEEPAVPPPPFDDVPLVSQEAPETAAFVRAYVDVGRPRLVIFVNRTLQGEILPVNPADPTASVEHTRSANAGVTVERRDTQSSDGVYHSTHSEASDKTEFKGPGQYKETTAVYLKPGQYDEASAKSIDYEAVENILTDSLSGNGQVVLMSPTLVRQKLTDQQIKDLESGRPQVASEIVKQLGSDILIQFAAHPTKQTQHGLAVRLVGEAMNIRDGQSLGRVVVDIPPPLDKVEINKFTRYSARKLMHDMTMTWSAPPPTAGNATPPAPMEKQLPTAPPLPPPIIEKPTTAPTTQP